MNEQDRMIELILNARRSMVGERLSCALARNCYIAEFLIANNVTIPPVSVGQTVYIIRRPTERPAWIDECEITYLSVHYFKDGKSTVFNGYNFEVAECDIGERVFLAREEAEQALKERV